MSLKNLVVGTIAMSSVNVVRLLAQFIAIPIISRLLPPAEYGIVAIAMPFIIFAMMFADAGIGMSLVRVPARDRRLWSSCFWLSIILGVALVIIILLVAPIPAVMYGQPALTPIVRALTVIVFAHAVCAIPKAAMQQAHQFTRIAGIEIIALLAGIGAAIASALNGGGAWALVDQQLAFFIVRVILVCWLSSFRPLMVFDLSTVREHVTFGHKMLWVSISDFCTQIGENGVISNVLGTTALGIYSMAFQFARLPAKVVTGPLQYVLYAQLARLAHDMHAVRHAYLSLTRILAIIVFPAVGMVAVAHRPVFELLLSSKWASSGEVFMVVAPATALQGVMALGGTVRMALGRADIGLRTSVEFSLLWMTGLVASAWGGLQWVAMTYTAAALLYSPRSLMLVLPVIECSPSMYCRTIVLPILMTIACGGVYLQCNHGAMLSEWMQVCLAGVLAVLGVAGSALVQRQHLVNEAAYLRKVLRRDLEVAPLSA